MWCWKTRWFRFAIGHNNRLSGEPWGAWLMWHPQIVEPEYNNEGHLVIDPIKCAWLMNVWCWGYSHG